MPQADAIPVSATPKARFLMRLQSEPAIGSLWAIAPVGVPGQLKLPIAGRCSEATEWSGTMIEEAPCHIMQRILEGEGPIKVWREHRCIPIAALANKVGLSSAEMIELEIEGQGAGIYPIVSVEKGQARTP